METGQVSRKRRKRWQNYVRASQLNIIILPVQDSLTCVISISVNEIFYWLNSRIVATICLDIIN